MMPQVDAINATHVYVTARNSSNYYSHLYGFLLQPTGLSWVRCSLSPDTVGRSLLSQQGKPNNSRGVLPSTCSPDSFKWTKELLIRVPARSKIQFRLIDVEYPPTRDNIDSLVQPTTFRHRTYDMYTSLPFVPLLHQQACRYLLAYQPFNDNEQSVKVCVLV